MKYVINGRDVLKLPGTGAKHRSEKLCNFILEYPSKDPPSLTCTVDCDFKYDADEMVRSEVIHLVYPPLEQKPESAAIGQVQSASIGQVHFHK